MQQEFGKQETMEQGRSFASDWPWLSASLIIVVLGFFLRLHNLGDDSFWIDEILTVRTTGGGIEAITAVRDHPPLLYTLTWISTEVFGEREFAARLPALFAGLLTIPLLIRMGREWGRKEAGIWAGILLVLVPFHIGLSQTARHYSLLTAITLATYLVLYRALKRPHWMAWLKYGALTLLNLYTHYGAFIVLASQTVLIGGWLLARLIRRRWRWEQVLMPAATAFGIFLLYLPWLTRFQQALADNTGRGTMTGTGSLTPFSQWLNSVFWTFNIDGRAFAYVLGVLALTGLAVLAWRHRTLELALLVATTIGSIVLIGVFQVARGPFARYVSFILPFYLFSAGISLATTLQMIPGLGIKRLISVGIVLGLVMIARPGIQREYDYVLEDWQSVLSYLEIEADEGDVIVGLSMNYRQGFNLVAASLPYYLEQEASEYVYLPGNQLHSQDLAVLEELENDVWGIVFDWNNPTMLQKDSSELEVKPFQTALYLVKPVEQEGTSLDKVEALYSHLIPLVDEPAQRCLLQEDWANVVMAAGEWERLADELELMAKSCPQLVGGARLHPLEQAVLIEHFESELARGNVAKSRSLAAQVLVVDRKNDRALVVLTAENLVDLYRDGKVIVEDEESPEPVRLERFTMPQNGDWGDVLLIHPPATVTFDLTLPDEPVTFHTRLAMAPQSWGWGGDGATFVLRIQPAGQGPRELFRQHIGNAEADHKWHEVDVPLTKYAGQQVSLILATENGPAGDGTGDWAGWETPRLMWDVPN